ncbi:hypothetical protein DICA4_D19614 [Diutina catenulata]
MFCIRASRWAPRTLAGPRPMSTKGFDVIDRCPIECGCADPVLPQPIDTTTNLNGTKPVLYKHVLVPATAPVAELSSKVELIPESLTAEFARLKRTHLDPDHPVAMSMVECPGLDQVVVYPDAIAVPAADVARDVASFIASYLRPADLPPRPVYNPFGSRQPTAVPTSSTPKTFAATPFPQPMLLICGHAARDSRCGVMGPVLRQAFEAETRAQNADVAVGLISHIGGHAYAGNVIYFSGVPHEPPVWYGRVFPKHVRGIVAETVLRHRVIGELFRGSLDSRANSR